MKRGRPQIPISEEQIQQVLESKEPISNFLRGWGISRGTLYRRLKALYPDFDGRARRRFTGLLPEVLKLKAEGLSTHKIARKLGVSQTWVWRELKKATGDTFDTAVTDTATTEATETVDTTVYAASE